MAELFGFVAKACAGVARALRWPLASVDDEPQLRPVPMPGPAHGPVTAIDVRLGKDRRRV
jgi:hypothetical protein